MKRLWCILLALCLLCGCGAAPETAAAPEASDSAPEAEASAEETPEEAFLQSAWQYLQSDEKELFPWDSGVLEDFRTEESRLIICPQGETDIQGMELQRVRYTRYSIGGMSFCTNLYFTADGEFVGTDGSSITEAGSKVNGSVLEEALDEQRQDRYWDGDVSFYLFLSDFEIAPDETFTATTVLKNNSDTARSFRAYAPKITYLGYFQDGAEAAGGIDASAQVLTLEPGEVFVETSTLYTSMLRERGLLHTGEMTLLAFVYLQDYTEETYYDFVDFTLTHTATVTLTE